MREYQFIKNIYFKELSRFDWPIILNNFHSFKRMTNFVDDSENDKKYCIAQLEIANIENKKISIPKEKKITLSTFILNRNFYVNPMDLIQLSMEEGKESKNAYHEIKKRYPSLNETQDFDCLFIEFSLQNLK